MRMLKNPICSLLLVSSILLSVSAAGTDEKQDTFFELRELVSPDKASAFQTLVSSQGIPLSGKQLREVNIALIYPNQDVSDFWNRNYLALQARLTALGIRFTIEEFSSKQIEHALQSKHTDSVLEQAQNYDFVIFGPSELDTQADNIQRLAANKGFQTYIWAFHTPYRKWKHQPRAWFDFSSSIGANKICHYMLRRLGPEREVFLNRGIPGITDDQRSGELINCVKEQGRWEITYEHFGQYQKYGGFDGAKLKVRHFPRTTILHNANTAMTLGAVEALEEAGLVNDVFTSGWGGTKKEIELIKAGKLNATPMRMSDDMAVATAEAIKLTLEGRENEVPIIYLGRFVIANDRMSNKELDSLSEEAFRYSGDGKR